LGRVLREVPHALVAEVLPVLFEEGLFALTETVLSVAAVQCLVDIVLLRHEERQRRECRFVSELRGPHNQEVETLKRHVLPKALANKMLLNLCVSCAVQDAQDHCAGEGLVAKNGDR